jgi:hypothetical protein
MTLDGGLSPSQEHLDCDSAHRRAHQGQRHTDDHDEHEQLRERKALVVSQGHGSSPSDDGATASKIRAQHSTTLVVVVAKANHTEPTFIASLNRALPGSARGFPSHSLTRFDLDFSRK